MSSNPTHRFPSPVGGVPYPLDLIPSILFAALYGLLVPVVLWRMIHARSRTFILAGTVFFGIERVVGFALRGYAAQHAGSRESLHLNTYFQTTLAAGFLTFGNDLAMLTRAVLVDATLGTKMFAVYKGKSSTPSPPLAAPRDEPPEDGVYPFIVDDSEEREDHPRMRFWIRRFCEQIALLYIAVTIVSAIAGITYKKAIESSSGVDLLQSLRYYASAVGVFCLLSNAVGAVWMCYLLPRVPKRSVMWIVVVTALLTIVGVYRLVVMGYHTTSILSTAPGSLNSTGAKIAFYVFHMAPELIAAAILMSLNARREFATGLWGDLRSSDPVPKVHGAQTHSQQP